MPTGRDAGAHERSCPVAHDPAKHVHVHSDVCYPGTLGPGTARISDLLVSQDNSCTMYHIIFEEVYLERIAHVQDTKGTH